MRQCWCGERELAAFSAGYGLCRACGGLVSLSRLEGGGDDWLVGRAVAGLAERAETELSGPCLERLDALLRYCRPPGRLAQIGSGHGGLVVLAGMAGFGVEAVEPDAGAAEVAAKAFGIMSSRDYWDLGGKGDGLDGLLIVDALERMPNPLTVLEAAAGRLGPKGVLVIETPRYPEGRSHERLVEEGDPFLTAMRPREHVFLYGEWALRELLRRVGLVQARFEDGVSGRDMRVVASRQPLTPAAREDIRAALLASPGGRVALAMLAGLDKRDGDREEGSRAEIWGVVRDMASGMVSEARLPALVNRVLMRVSRFAWAVNKARKFVLRERVGRRGLDGGHRDDRLVAVDLTPVLPGGDNGGAKLMTLALVRMLAVMRPNWRFVCLTGEAAHDELAHLDAPNVERVRAGGLGKLKGLREYGGRRVDLLFCPFTMPYFHHPDVPLVSVVYDLQYAYYPRFFSSEEEAGRERTFMTAARYADRLVCISEFVRGTVLEKGDLPPSRVETVHIGLPARLARRTEAAAAAVLKAHGLTKGGYLIYPANFWPHKNHAMLLTAFGLYLRGRPESRLRLVLTGADTGLRRELVAAVGRMGLADRAVFTGYVSDPDMAALLQSAGALIFPSLFEGFGMPLVEAMALGVPVLCAGGTSLPEVGGEACLYFDPKRPDDIARAIDRFESDPAAVAAMVARGPERLAAIGGPEAMAREYLRIFEEVMTRGLAAHAAARGIFPDRLTSGRVLVAAGPAAHRQWLEARFDWPEAAPMTRVTLQAFVNGRPWGKQRTVKRGGGLDLAVDIPPAGGVVELELSPTFRPFDHGLGDRRERVGLSCRVLRLTDGERAVDLLPRGEA